MEHLFLMFLDHTLRLQAAPLLRSWVRIPPGAWIFVCCECRVLSGRGLCDELITRSEESYQLWCVVVCNLETSRIGAPYIYIYIYIYDISSLRVNKQGLTPLSPAMYEWFGDVVPGGKVFASCATQFMATVAVLFCV